MNSSAHVRALAYAGLDRLERSPRIDASTSIPLTSLNNDIRLNSTPESAITEEVTSMTSAGAEQDKAPASTNTKVWYGVVIGFNEKFSEYSLISIFSSICKKYVFQLEKSENGFVHWQCLLSLKKRTTRNHVLKLLKDFHIPDNRNVQIINANKNMAIYCSKRDTRVKGPWSKGFKGIPTEPINTIPRCDFYPWQEEVVSLLEGPVDDRIIYWYYDIEGCKGKTALAKWLVVHKEAFLFKGGANDMANRIILEGAPKIAVMNLSRTQEKYVSYQTIEDIKDGLIVSGKYEGGQLVFNPPHIVVFANFRPEEEKLSADRWNIKCLDSESFTGVWGNLFEYPEETD